MQGHFREGGNFLEHALRLPYEGARTEQRARALCGAGACAFRKGNYIIVTAFLEESVATYRKLNSRSALALSLMFLALVRTYQRNDTATHLLEESIRLSQDGGDNWSQGWVLYSAARIAWKRGDAQSARAFLEESVVRARQRYVWVMNRRRRHAISRVLLLPRTVDQPNASRALVRLGDMAQQRSDDSTALTYYRNCLAHARAQDEQQIAGQLVISYRTVTTHLNSFCTKLGVNSRSAATRFAIEHHLA